MPRPMMPIPRKATCALLSVASDVAMLMMTARLFGVCLGARCLLRSKPALTRDAGNDLQQTVPGNLICEFVQMNGCWVL